jgi:hypothetical protein
MLNFENLQPGMVLGADVKDRNGRVLLAAGQEITEKSLRVFRMWGVTEADVRGVVQEEVAAMTLTEFPPEVLQASETKLAGLFLHCNREHPVIKELLRLTIIRAARKMEETNGTVGQSA